jgi:hypothetical protein
MILPARYLSCHQTTADKLAAHGRIVEHIQFIRHTKAMLCAAGVLSPGRQRCPRSAPAFLLIKVQLIRLSQTDYSNIEHTAEKLGLSAR